MMRRALVLLIGIWVFAAPSVCLALCPEMPTAAEFGSVTAEPSKAPCHQTAPSNRSTADSEPFSAPVPSDDCCLEQQLQSSQASAPESPRAPLVFAFGATAEIVDAGALTIGSTLRLEVQRSCAPYQQSNPPLLI